MNKYYYEYDQYNSDDKYEIDCNGDLVSELINRKLFTTHYKTKKIYMKKDEFARWKPTKDDLEALTASIKFWSDLKTNSSIKLKEKWNDKKVGDFPGSTFSGDIIFEILCEADEKEKLLLMKLGEVEEIKEFRMMTKNCDTKYKYELAKKILIDKTEHFIFERDKNKNNNNKIKKEGEYCPPSSYII